MIFYIKKKRDHYSFYNENKEILVYKETKEKPKKKKKKKFRSPKICSIHVAKIILSSVIKQRVNELFWGGKSVDNGGIHASKKLVYRSLRLYGYLNKSGGMHPSISYEVIRA